MQIQDSIKGSLKSRSTKSITHFTSSSSVATFPYPGIAGMSQLLNYRVSGEKSATVDENRE
jgi:hypothetical protein